MSLAELKKNFIQQVKLRAYDDQYVDKDEELEILKAALDSGINLDSARGVLMQVCESENYVLESRVLSEIKDLIDTFAGNDGKIDQKEFTDAVTVAKKRTNGKKSELECKRMVLELIEEHRYTIKSGMMSNWYKKAKKDVGMA